MHSGTGVGVGYNVQIAVDTKHKLIAEQQVHSQVSDLGLLAENVRGEFSLTALAYNIRRATTLVGVPELIAAVRP